MTIGKLIVVILVTVLVSNAVAAGISIIIPGFSNLSCVKVAVNIEPNKYLCR
jgi:hypothetical protein